MKKISLLILFGFIMVACGCGRSGSLYLPHQDKSKQTSSGKYDI